jgi:hypothetical protein
MRHEMKNKKPAKTKFMPKEEMVKCTHWRDCNVNNGGCCAINKYSRPSVAICLTICDEKFDRPQGLGDTVAKVIERVSRGKIKPKTGGGCGCNKRRKKLNNLLPYGKNKREK